MATQGIEDLVAKERGKVRSYASSQNLRTKLPPRGESLSHPRLPHPNRSHTLINVGPGRQHHESLMFFTLTWGSHFKVPSRCAPAPSNARDALHIQELLGFTGRREAWKPTFRWKAFYMGEYRSPSWAF